jgi:aromatic ring-opening dioxygenase LigB subunit
MAPHGGEIIEELCSTENVKQNFKDTRDGMLHLAKDISRVSPDTIVIASPHNLRLWKKIGIVIAQNSSGELTAAKKTRLRLRCSCDTSLAWKLLKASEQRKLPVVAANFGASEGPSSDMQMDWGTFVPLWFFLKALRRKPRIVIVTPSREIRLTENYLFGRLIANICKELRTRVVFVASADQSHVHQAGGPYGVDKTAATKFDQSVIRAIAADNIEALLKISPKLVERAKPDSLWQIAMLAGLFSLIPMKATIYSYDVPTYYGMICAGFKP